MQNGRHVPLYREIRFLDSFQFMSQSLESLAKSMQSSSLQLLRNKFSDMSDFDSEKIRGKGFFSLTFISTTLKNFANLFSLTGTLGESLSGKVYISE